MDSQPTVGPVLVDELKKQAREEGYFVFTLSHTQFALYFMYALGVVAGYLLSRSD
jgi:hypothetical protein